MDVFFILFYLIILHYIILYYIKSYYIKLYIYITIQNDQFLTSPTKSPMSVYINHTLEALRIQVAGDHLGFPRS